MKLCSHLDIFAGICIAFTLGQGARLRLDQHNDIVDRSTISSNLKRAVPDAPSGNYAPSKVQCPKDRPKIRSASTLSREETAWLKKRRSKTIQPMKDFLTRANIMNFDAGAYIEKNKNNVSALPNIGLAASGGGYRALLNGGGVIKAFDVRTENATMKGHLGGLLQSSTYIAGLSGGGWLLGSIFVNNFSTVANLQSEASGSLWEFGNSIFKGPKESGISIINTASYYKDIEEEVGRKQVAGYKTTFTDYWGRALSYQLVDARDGGPAITWSSIAKDTQFMNADTPMPILVADGRPPGEIIISSNATNYEFNPFEMGTFDPTAHGFAPLQYIGSEFSAGELAKDKPCIRGLDNVGFIMGTSSSLFNQGLLLLSQADVPDAFNALRDRIVKKLQGDEEDIADYQPNPFYKWNPETNPNANAKSLTLVDGGEDLQNIPLNPLIQPTRNVDVIFAIDSSADTDINWPNGTAMVATYERSKTDIENGTAFPSIPDQNTFVNLGINNRPVFFGCNSSNMTGPAPLIVYIPNAPYVYQSNPKTFTASTNDTERDVMVLNGYNVATMGNGTLDAQWPVCVSCAILSRSLERTKTQVPAACQDCFQRYCWDGKVDSSMPKPYRPGFKLAEVHISNAKCDKSSLRSVTAAVGFSLAMMFIIL